RFSSLWAHGQHADIERTAIGVMDHAMPALFNTTGYSIVGHQASFEIIMMPLRSSNSACDRVLGAIAPVAAASWLEIVPLEFLALDR
ncbi:PAS domain-containing protein, partial [Pseudomonas sp. BGM005]|nr:PAS domain-containing protein [Pseudomonas sp. BG5]